MQSGRCNFKKKHKALSDQVEEAQRAPGVSDQKIAELKKQKLRLKEEIARLAPAM